ncbi:MAG: efflux RND transporter periplasmic adaptor subunit [Planctomycetota bacterium]|nr:efflux RND transporter periplasmic adaptor subunit [Planctomycetota bacterium]
MADKRNILVSVITQVVVSMALLAVAVGIYVVLLKTKPRPQGSVEPPAMRRVEVMHVIEVPVRRQWTGFGTAAAMDSADVPVQVSAIVVEVPRHIVAGAEIKDGDVLAEFDKTDFVQQVNILSQRIAEIAAQLDQLRVEEASLIQRAALAGKETELAERELERVLDAFERNGANQREIDRAEVALKVRQRLETFVKEERDKIAPRRAQLAAKRLGLDAELALANKDVERCTVRSPLGGVIQAVDVEVGERLALGERVARVVSLQRIEVALRLPGGTRAAIAVGDEVILTSRNATTQSWPGQVARIGPQDDETTRTMAVYVEVEQDPHDRGLLAPGLFVQGTVVSSEVELRSVVPRRSLLGDRLLLIEDNVVRSYPVQVVFHVQGDFPQIGVAAEQWAVLAEPLPAGALVVVNAARSLPEGLEVEAIPLNGPPQRARAGDPTGMELGTPDARSGPGVGR